MIRDTLRKLEAKVRDAKGASEAVREDLLALLDELRDELEVLEEPDASQARDLADQALVVASEAGPREDEEAGGVVPDLEEIVRDFEATHPRLVGVLRTFFKTLGDAGI